MNLSVLVLIKNSTNVELTEKICSIINANFSLKHNCLDLITYVDDRLGHDFRYAIDASKIRKNLEWKPKYSFEESNNEND